MKYACIIPNARSDGSIFLNLVRLTNFLVDGSRLVMGMQADVGVADCMQEARKLQAAWDKVWKEIGDQVDFVTSWADGYCSGVTRKVLQREQESANPITGKVLASLAATSKSTNEEQDDAPVHLKELADLRAVSRKFSEALSSTSSTTGYSTTASSTPHSQVPSSITTSSCGYSALSSGLPLQHFVS